MTAAPAPNFWIDDNGGLCVSLRAFNDLTSEKALDLAIEKWRVIAGYDFSHRLYGYAADSCALCELYFDDDGSCNDCPVGNDCLGTPFAEFQHAMNTGENENLKALAAKEADFLQSLKNGAA